ncbi:MAG: peptide chain release factor N(5)-glutamine methyltransferase [Bacteroidia bacterium]|nr:MAG: peptide chain release factor N(5)-glutamine methyltransferase [Bacteroidia bacterium]
MLDLKSNKICDVYQWFKSGLAALPEQVEHPFLCNEIFSRFFGITPVQRVLEPDKRLSESDIVLLIKARKRLNKGEPVQYITGKADFLGNTFAVDPNVLIPRPETEGLVLWLAENLKGSNEEQQMKKRILDVGTGSGVIAVSLAFLFPDDEILACDYREKILELANYNSRINNVLVSFFLCDIIAGETAGILPGSLDVVISNPPYVRESEKVYMSGNVLEHEPVSALFVPDDDPLLYYRNITCRSNEWLRDGGWVYFEINEAMGEECTSLLKGEGLSNILVKRDIHGKKRYIRAQKS